MSNIYRYLLIESGPVLEKAKAIQADHMVSLKAAFEFAKKYGADSIFTNAGGFFTGPVSVIGIAVVTPQPEGWKLSRDRTFMQPRAKAKKLNAEMAALPKFPDTRSLADTMVGFNPNPNITKASEDGTITSSQGLPHAQLIWTGGSFCICIPLHGFFGDMTKETIDHANAVPVPDGCREITQAQWELIKATAAVNAEAAA